MVPVEFARSLADSVKALALAGIECQWRVKIGGCFLHFIREEMARDFLKSDYTDLVFIDADMGWSDGLLRILTHDVDVVGAMCPKRKDSPEWACAPLGETRGGLIECSYIGTAFLRIRRSVIERMPRCFDAGYEGERRIGEDAWFCREWRKLGGKVWADPSIHVTHTGLKTWDFGTYVGN